MSPSSSPRIRRFDVVPFAPSFATASAFNATTTSAVIRGSGTGGSGHHHEEEEERAPLPVKCQPPSPPSPPYGNVAASSHWFKKQPTHRIHLMPSAATPIEQLGLPEMAEDSPYRFFVKRDDMVGGMETTGNKLRKLEFLMADAVVSGCDAVVTAGGTQSNHARATAAVARRLGLAPYLVLRDDGHSVRLSSGNCLLNRLLGANVDVMSREDYIANGGGGAAVKRKVESLEATGEAEKPYGIDVGGSNWLGSWGYLQMCREELFGHVYSATTAPQQQRQPYPTSTTMTSAAGMEDVDDDEGLKWSPSPVLRWSAIVSAAGSGGTLCGLALGTALADFAATSVHHGGGWCGGVATRRSATHRPLSSSRPPAVIGYGVCDDPNWFLNKVASLLEEMVTDGGANSLVQHRRQWGAGSGGGGSLYDDLTRSLCEVRDAKNLGYGKATDEELQFLCRVSRESGIVFDPTYGNKALHAMWRDAKVGALPLGPFAAAAAAGDGGGGGGDDDAMGRSHGGRFSDVLFIHTGGGPSVFEWNARLSSLPPIS